ncbi:hypothetical protein BD408DRAFT_418950 [Parasitella parasitica]|nr:hypothetical protein BD408DRAFT_418950 [Parasitella parasitica]
MFDSSKSVLEKLTAEALVNVASFLDLASILQLSLTGKPFCHLIRDELVFKQLNKRAFHVIEKGPEQTWLSVYKHLDTQTVPTTETPNVQQNQTSQSYSGQPVADTTQNTMPTVTETLHQTAEESMTDPCPHFVKLADIPLDAKKIIFKSEESYLCDLCANKPATYLSMGQDDYTGACLSCLSQPVDCPPIQLELVTGDLYCFKCHHGQPRKLNGQRDGQLVQDTIDYIRDPESMEDLEKRRKIEQSLYVQELRREDMSLKHYLVEKQWGRTWMSFRTREGAPLPTKITQQRLSRANGSLDPNIRLPMDKYRPCPETHGDIVSEKLWRYLAKAYGVQGRAYNEDDIIAPEYARIRVYVDDFKKSIHLYP